MIASPVRVFCSRAPPGPSRALVGRGRRRRPRRPAALALRRGRADPLRPPLPVPPRRAADPRASRAAPVRPRKRRLAPVAGTLDDRAPVLPVPGRRALDLAATCCPRSSSSSGWTPAWRWRSAGLGAPDRGPARRVGGGRLRAGLPRHRAVRLDAHREPAHAAPRGRRSRCSPTRPRRSARRGGGAWPWPASPSASPASRDRCPPRSCPWPRCGGPGSRGRAPRGCARRRSSSSSAAAAILPWTARNALVIGDLVPVESISVYNFWDDNAFAEGERRRHQESVIASQPTLADQRRVAMAFGFRGIVRSPALFAEKAWRNLQHIVRLDGLHLWLRIEEPHPWWRHALLDPARRHRDPGRDPALPRLRRRRGAVARPVADPAVVRLLPAHGGGRLPQRDPLPQHAAAVRPRRRGGGSCRPARSRAAPAARGARRPSGRDRELGRAPRPARGAALARGAGLAGDRRGAAARRGGGPAGRGAPRLRRRQPRPPGRASLARLRLRPRPGRPRRSRPRRVPARRGAQGVRVDAAAGARPAPRRRGPAGGRRARGRGRLLVAGGPVAGAGDRLARAARAERGRGAPRPRRLRRRARVHAPAARPPLVAAPRVGPAASHRAPRPRTR